MSEPTAGPSTPTSDTPEAPTPPLQSSPVSMSKAAPSMESFNRKLVVSLVVALVITLLVIAGLATKIATGSGDIGDRTVSVTGEATLEAEPDEYVFYPTYSFKNASKDAALADMTKKSN